MCVWGGGRLELRLLRRPYSTLLLPCGCTKPSPLLLFALALTLLPLLACPQIKALRLSYKTAHTWRPSSEQEVLHYQRFADFGNADAARAVAHMLSHGAARDYGQAVRYLQQVRATGWVLGRMGGSALWGRCWLCVAGCMTGLVSCSSPATVVAATVPGWLASSPLPPVTLPVPVCLRAGRCSRRPRCHGPPGSHLRKRAGGAARQCNGGGLAL